MAAARPFASFEELLTVADREWDALGPGARAGRLGALARRRTSAPVRATSIVPSRYCRPSTVTVPSVTYAARSLTSFGSASSAPAGNRASRYNVGEYVATGERAPYAAPMITRTVAPPCVSSGREAVG